MEVLCFLIVGGVNLGALDPQRRTVLQLACEHGDLAVVACLMERRAELVRLRQEKKGTKVRRRRPPTPCCRGVFLVLTGLWCGCGP